MQRFWLRLSFHGSQESKVGAINCQFLDMSGSFTCRAHSHVGLIHVLDVPEGTCIIAYARNAPKKLLILVGSLSWIPRRQTFGNWSSSSSESSLVCFTVHLSPLVDWKQCTQQTLCCHPLNVSSFLSYQPHRMSAAYLALIAKDKGLRMHETRLSKISRSGQALLQCSLICATE